MACSVLSGNRNFEGRVSPDVQANYLASPPLVVAYAIAGTMTHNLTTEPVGQDQNGNAGLSEGPLAIHQRKSPNSSASLSTRKCSSKNMPMYSRAMPIGRKSKVTGGDTYAWDDKSTYVQNPPYFEGMTMDAVGISDIKGARVLGLFGDKITTDHISPAGSIKQASPPAAI